MGKLADERRAAAQRALQLIQQSDSGVEGLIRLIEAPDLPGDTARARMSYILRLTAGGLPGLQMGLFPPDDSGFCCELADQRFYLSHDYWADFVKPPRRVSKQVGHFLTAVGLRLNRWPLVVKLRLIVGHEKFGDRLLATFLIQLFAASAADVRRFLEALEADEAGDAKRRDARLHQILGTPDEALRDPHRIGNSLPDLRLSLKGWRLGQALLTGAILTRGEAADWLRHEIYDPTRTRVCLPLGMSAGAPC